MVLIAFNKNAIAKLIQIKCLKYCKQMIKCNLTK